MAAAAEPSGRVLERRPAQLPGAARAAVTSETVMRDAIATSL